MTGASSNHVGCLRNLLVSLDRFEKAPVIVYDLGLSAEEAATLRAEGRTLVRFPFEAYPRHFGRGATRARPYAWKPTLIHEVMTSARGPVLWLDAGDLVHERLDAIRAVLAETGVYSPGSQGTIADWTHPRTLALMQASPDVLGDRNRNGALVGFGTNHVGREISGAWRDAVLRREIIHPRGWSRKRHRSDQALLSVLVAQARRKYQLELIDQLLGVSLHNDELTAEEAARLMAMPLREALAAQKTAREAARARRQAGQERWRALPVHARLRWTLTRMVRRAFRGVS